jgi:hypothetical protein
MLRYLLFCSPFDHFNRNSAIETFSVRLRKRINQFDELGLLFRRFRLDRSVSVAGRQKIVDFRFAKRA